MEAGQAATELINSFALVAYIPDPLGKYLDEVRCELVPSCVPHAHVTILPPRPLAVSAEQAWYEISSKLRELPAFDIRLGDVDVFSKTSVIYIGLRSGLEDFQRLNHVLNTDSLHLDEPFPYHPHVTVAQDLAWEQVPGVYETARVRWAECPYSRRFPIETITFVQNTRGNRWRDLAQCTLNAVTSVP
jgi:2'-5' RNA ligase